MQQYAFFPDSHRSKDYRNRGALPHIKANTGGPLHLGKLRCHLHLSNTHNGKPPPGMEPSRYQRKFRNYLSCLQTGVGHMHAYYSRRGHVEGNVTVARSKTAAMCTMILPKACRTFQI